MRRLEVLAQHANAGLASPTTCTLMPRQPHGSHQSYSWRHTCSHPGVRDVSCVMSLRSRISCNSCFSHSSSYDNYFERPPHGTALCYALPPHPIRPPFVWPCLPRYPTPRPNRCLPCSPVTSKLTGLWRPNRGLLDWLMRLCRCSSAKHCHEDEPRIAVAPHASKARPIHENSCNCRTVAKPSPDNGPAANLALAPTKARRT